VRESLKLRRLQTTARSGREIKKGNQRVEWNLLNTKRKHIVFSLRLLSTPILSQTEWMKRNKKIRKINALNFVCLPQRRRKTIFSFFANKLRGKTSFFLFVNKLNPDVIRGANKTSFQGCATKPIAS
jgi:hypothetical protein